MVRVKRECDDYEMNGVRLEKSKEVDLGMTVTEDLTPDKHIDKIAGGMMNLLEGESGFFVSG